MMLNSRDKWINTTLVYIRKDGKTLLLNRNKRDDDMHKGKYVGLGGKFEPGETAHQCLVREVKEESNLDVLSSKLHGIIDFPMFDGKRNIRSFVYVVDDFSGSIKENYEGELHWISDEEVLEVPSWEGDRIFLSWLYEDKPFFYASFHYENDNYIDYEVSWEERMNPVVVIEMESGKKIEIELYRDVAPKTVENFLKLVNNGFYDGIIFHRVIEGFVIQGGDPDGTGMGGPGWTIPGEFTSNGFANNLRHTRGVISMARTNDPNSAGSQFFIMHDDVPRLDGEYAAFGKVISGMDVVDEIATTKTGPGDKPVDEQKMKTVNVKEA